MTSDQESVLWWCVGAAIVGGLTHAPFGSLVGIILVLVVSKWWK